MGGYRTHRVTDTPSPLVDDLQASVPEVPLALTRAGVTGVSKAIRIRHDGRDKTFSAEISCTVDLDPGQKGVHMSRFPELFGEAIDAVVIGEAFFVETLAEHIAKQIVGRQGACRAEVRIEAQYPIERRTPVTGLPTQEIARLIGIAAATPTGCAGRDSPPATSTGSSSSSRWRPTTSAAAARSSSAPTRASTRST